jgi:hypothetical protein
LKKGKPLRFVSFRFVSFRFVSFRFVSFRFVSFRFVSFRFVSLILQSKSIDNFASIKDRQSHIPLWNWSHRPVDQTVEGEAFRLFAAVENLQIGSLGRSSNARAKLEARRMRQDST